MKKRLLLLGAGPTNSLVTFNIKNSPKLKDRFEITIWEKSRGVGGRFSTSRNPNNPLCTADLGAQYLTFSGQAFSKPYFENLERHQLLREFDTSNIPGFHHDLQKKNYVCSEGTSSIVKHFFTQGGESSICFNKEADGLFPTVDNTVKVSLNSGESEEFDAVVSTVPVPQLLQFKNIDNILKDQGEIKTNLSNVKYTSRYALGLFYDDPKGPFPFEANSETFSALNFVNDSVIRYWSIENLKRSGSWPSKSLTDPCAIVAHTSVKFGAENVESTPGVMKDAVLEKVRRCITHIGNQNREPSFVKCHKWRYSQVESPYAGAPACVPLTKHILATGDGFTKSGFEGCIIASQKTTEYLEQIV